MRIAMTVAMIVAATGTASAQWAVTEVFTGLSGEDGTQDWIEVTWLGAGTGDTGSLIYDDSNPNVGNAGTLDSFVLGTGESAVFLLDTVAVDDLLFADAITEFEAIWGVTGNIGYTNGGGALGQGSDSANIGVDNAGSFDTIASLSYSAGGQLETTQQLGGTVSLSVLGQDGAFESNPFFNDNLGLPGDTATLVGSPLAIPAPASIALLALGGVIARRQR